MEAEITYVKVLELDKLAPGKGCVVHAGTKKLALFNVKGEYHCIQNFCPHAGGFLGLGEFEGCIVRCPRHAWGFDVTSGECKTNGRYSARTYPTRLEDGWVWVGMTDDPPM
jgi:nitrite reductase/ring-hydroxylating ferredoxin subunit